MEIVEVNYSYAILPFWLILILWGLGGGALGGLVGGLSVYLFDLFRPGKDVDIAILGTEGAGKTTLWKAITQSEKNVEPTIAGEVINEATVYINSIKRRIKQSLDINGGPDAIRMEYKNLISQKDFIIFIFNTKDFLENKEAVEDVKMRLKVIEKYKDSSKTFHIIGSHIDRLTNNLKTRKKVKNEVVNILGIEFLKEINCDRNKNVTLINLTNKEEVDMYINNVLFNEK